MVINLGVINPGFINPGQILAPVSQALGNLRTSPSPVPLPTVPLSVQFGQLTGGVLLQQNFPLLDVARAALLPRLTLTSPASAPILTLPQPQAGNKPSDNRNHERENGRPRFGKRFGGFGFGFGFEPTDRRDNPFSRSNNRGGGLSRGGGRGGDGR
ncbi:MAG: hypothetical protein VKJ04_01805 [Vampirovibrionales bacterium]|nr:hypothetical protein [Vampirovibrionales bacterium]